MALSRHKLPVLICQIFTRLLLILMETRQTLLSSQVAIDEQIGMTFTQNFPSLTYNVTAVAQQDSDNYGPAYLLNGLTSAGYWYQIGIAWQWPELNGGYTTGFNVNYNVFNSKGTVVLPPNGSGGVIATTGGTINQGDNVGLSLTFSGSNVLMKVYDWSTWSHSSSHIQLGGRNSIHWINHTIKHKRFFFGTHDRAIP